MVAATVTEICVLADGMWPDVLVNSCDDIAVHILMFKYSMYLRQLGHATPTSPDQMAPEDLRPLLAPANN
jgi:hypothetical protein